MGSKTHTLAEFNELLGSRMTPTAKANFLKGLSVAGLVSVDLSVNRETGEMNSRISAINPTRVSPSDSA